MIRLNLLPFRAARKKENIRKQISVFALSILLLFVILIFTLICLNMRQSALETDKAAKKKELAGYAETNKRIAAIKKKIAGINKKLNAIKTIEKNRQGPVRLLDEIARAVPKNKLWLRSLSQKKGAVTLEGTASDHDVVALYMKNLEKMKSITSVDLKSTTLKHLQKQKVNVCDFALNLKTVSREKKPTPSKKKFSKRKK